MREQDAKARGKNFSEVACGYSLEDALREAQRCLYCPEPACVEGCPVSIDIPGFVRRIEDFAGNLGLGTDSKHMDTLYLFYQFFLG